MRSTEDLGSSHGWRLSRGVTEDGREVFAKTGGASELFASEAAGLRWLGEAIAVPEVIDVAGDRLVLSWVEAERPTPEAAERFGRDLARLHRAGAPAFGAPWPGFIAELPMDNTPADDWPEFYAAQRVLPFVRQARLSSGDVRLIEQAVDRFGEVAGPPEPPARIHGDLWSGNVLWSAGSGVLIDPAAHGGHRETDLAMLALFGVAYQDRVFGAYREESPLADGWRGRVPLHQLHPLLVHVVLYGEAYRSGLMAAVERVLAL
ncbi:fructosamine kinase family protein [Nonomuraea cavernae]|uniref:Fructosamine kinase n=1 Tax=Nonomuraea cavernae TaxID=2045107 RepID=A0A918DFV3_9ACTN|nr:fructosamine kinase family protein [Nonomuraea cavernae]MCA2184791.1 fructosamine kinase family protein [Nonomuraea cavernae]GGO64469.1 fructosamine kinase [Nonomuraea cavernae]